MPSEAVYPIRDVSRMTGVNPVTLRAWQRRYGLLKPARTATGHRLYSDDDIALIRQILHWLQRGVSISQVKGLIADPPPLSEGSNWETVRRRLLDFATALKIEALRRELHELASLYPVEMLLRNVMEPWLMDLAGLQRPDREIVQHSSQEVLRGILHNILSIERGPLVAVGSVGHESSLSLDLLRLELQGLELQSISLGAVEPEQLPLVEERLQVAAYVILLAGGLTESWFAKHHQDWPANTLFVGELGAIYREQRWLTRPYAKTISDLMRTPDAPPGLVSQ